MRSFSVFLFFSGFFCIALFVFYYCGAVFLGTVVEAFRGRGRKRSSPKEPSPSVTVLIAARNAQDLIGEKLKNTLSQNYPRDLLDVLVVSDGCEDDTASVARGFGERVKVFEFARHRGKIAALNEAMPLCSSEIVVFTDVDAMLCPDAVALLVDNMAENRSGGVCGKRVVGAGTQGFADSQRDYFRLESSVKLWESASGSVTSNDGKLYAVKRRFLTRIPEAVTDDLFLCLHVVLGGGRFTFEPDAAAAVPVPSLDEKHEVVRRRRIVGQSLRCMWLCRSVFDVRKHGTYSLKLFANKVLRRLFPFAVLAAIAGSAGALGLHWIFGAVCSIAAIFPVLCLASPFLPLGFRNKTARVRYFAVAAAATARGVLDFLAGNVSDKWEPMKSSKPNGNGNGKKKIAYIMSRFPKTTETFVLYEILGIMDSGFRVEIYPLLRQGGEIEHPGLESVKPFVRYSPLLSRAILAANLYWFARFPFRYFRLATRVFRGNLPSRVHLSRAVAIWPKSVWMAKQMRDRGVARIHAHFATHPALAAFIVGRLTGIPFGFTAHAHDIFMDKTMLCAKVEAADLVVSISEYNRRLLRRACPAADPGKIRVVRCGTDPAAFSPKTKRSSDDVFTIVCVASFKDMKGHRYLVEACAMLKRRGRKFRCLLVGDGPLREDIRERVRAAGVANEVPLLGPLPRESVSAIVAGADVMVLHCVTGARGDMDGIPVSLMEAMMIGIPVISTRLSGIPELVEHGTNGFLTAPGDSRALAKAVEALMDDPEWAERMGREGRRTVSRSYNIEENVKKLAAYFG